MPRAFSNMLGSLWQMLQASTSISTSGDDESATQFRREFKRDFGLPPGWAGERPYTSLVGLE